MLHKTFQLIETKADGDAGQFTALASVFGNVDHVGDRMMPGAFSKTLEQRRESGKTLPIIFSHDWEDPMKFIGEADPRAVMETDKGLLVQGKLDINNGNPVADQVYKAMKKGWITGWSFGYTVAQGGEKMAKDGANEISEVDLVEAGPTLKGANPEAQLQEVKSAVQKNAQNTSNTSLVNTTLANFASDEIGRRRDKAARDVGPAARAHLSNLIAYYMKKPHPFTACVRDNTKRFGPDGADRVCATLKDIGMGTTHWRHGGTSDTTWEAKAADQTDSPGEERDMAQELYDAAAGDFEGLMEMWHAHMVNNGDVAAPKSLPSKVETVESEKPGNPPVKPAAKDPLKNQIDRELIEIALGR